MVHDARQARLWLEYEKLMNVEALSEFIRIEPIMQPGWPPERYVVTYTCNGIAEIDKDQAPRHSDRHQVEVLVSAEYPEKQPFLKWLTPIWHPNFNPPRVCTNEEENWYPQKTLVDIVIMMGEMVQYKRYHAKHEKPWPLNQVAARWVVEYAEKRGILGPDKPFDPRRLTRAPRIRHGSLPALPPDPNEPQPTAKKKMRLGRITHAPEHKPQEHKPSENKAPEPPAAADGKGGGIKLGRFVTSKTPVDTPRRPYSLEVWRQGGRESTFPLDKPVINIGRGPLGVELVLEDQLVSDLQAVLEVDRNGAVWLTAKGASPVVVNGRELPPEKSVGVGVGDQIQISSYNIRVQ